MATTVIQHHKLNTVQCSRMITAMLISNGNSDINHPLSPF